MSPYTMFGPSPTQPVRPTEVSGIRSSKFLLVARNRRSTSSSYKTTEPINYIRLCDWTLVNIITSVQCDYVAYLYNKRIAPRVIAMERKSDRIITTHINGYQKLCIISAFAPPETFSSATKDFSFYEDLTELIFDIPPHTVLMETANIRIGKESHETNPITVGPPCYYLNTKNNGQRMIDLCEATDLRIALSYL